MKGVKGVKKLERSEKSTNLRALAGLRPQQSSNDNLVDLLQPNNEMLQDPLLEQNGDQQEPTPTQIVEEPLPNAPVSPVMPEEDTDPAELDQSLEEFRETLRNQPGYAEVLEQDDAIREEAVPANVGERLAAAQKAIEHVNNNVMMYGAGNQLEDIVTTRGVSRERARALKRKNVVSNDRSFRDGAEEARASVKAEHWKAGVCDDYAKVTLDYLRSVLSGVKLSRVANDRHAFVLIGDPSTETGDQVVVADPWPTRPQAVLWQDHFCYTEQPRVNAEITSDGKVDEKARKEVKPMKKQSAHKSLLGDAPLQQMLTKAREGNDIWFQRTSSSDGKAIFYYDPNWTTEVKALKRREFKAALLRSQHINAKARKNLKI